MLILLRFELECTFLFLNLFLNLSDQVLGLLSLLLRSSCHHLGILKVSLKLVVSLLQLRDFSLLFCLSRSLLLLLIGKFVQKLSVSRSSHRWVSCGLRDICCRAIAFIESALIAGRTAICRFSFESYLDPRALILALSNLDFLHFEVIVAELSQIEVTFAENTRSFVTGDCKLGLLKQMELLASESKPK